MSSAGEQSQRPTSSGEEDTANGAELINQAQQQQQQQVNQMVQQSQYPTYQYNPFNQVFGFAPQTMYGWPMMNTMPMPMFNQQAMAYQLAMQQMQLQSLIPSANSLIFPQILNNTFNGTPVAAANNVSLLPGQVQVAYLSNCAATETLANVDDTNSSSSMVYSTSTSLTEQILVQDTKEDPPSSQSLELNVNASALDELTLQSSYETTETALVAAEEIKDYPTKTTSSTVVDEAKTGEITGHLPETTISTVVNEVKAGEITSHPTENISSTVVNEVKAEEITGHPTKTTSSTVVDTSVPNLMDTAQNPLTCKSLETVICLSDDEDPVSSSQMEIFKSPETQVCLNDDQDPVSSSQFEQQLVDTPDQQIDIPIIEIEKAETQKCQCPNCSAKGGNQSKDPDGKPLHVCHHPGCGRTFNTSEYLKKHLLAIHSSKNDFICDYCDKEFAMKVNFVNHLRWHIKLFSSKDSRKNMKQKKHSSSSKESSKNMEQIEHLSLSKKRIRKSFPCNLCEKKFNSKTRLEYHMITHTSDKYNLVQDTEIYECDYCKEKVNRKVKLLQHIINTHMPKQKIHIKMTLDMIRPRLTCSRCPKFFFKITEFNAHLKLVHRFNPYVCSDCGKAFTNNRELRRHFKIHTVVEKNFGCSKCNKAYKCYDSLRRHNNLKH